MSITRLSLAKEEGHDEEDAGQARQGPQREDAARRGELSHRRRRR